MNDVEHPPPEENEPPLENEPPDDTDELLLLLNDEVPLYATEPAVSVEPDDEDAT